MGTPVEPVARGIAASILPAIASSSGAAWLGLLIHFGLAVTLGLGLALALQPVSRRVGTAHFELGLVMLALTAVWAVNFLIALPHINPAFVRLLPYSVTLLSNCCLGYRPRRSSAPIACAAKSWPVGADSNKFMTRALYAGTVSEEEDQQVSSGNLLPRLLQEHHTVGFILGLVIFLRAYAVVSSYSAKLLARSAPMRTMISTTILAGTAGVAAAILIAATTFTVATRQAEATPQYAKQTGLTCGQCHVDPKGGGKLRPFGERFKANGYKLK